MTNGTTSETVALDVGLGINTFINNSGGLEQVRHRAGG